jgi:hypothetical protein
MPWPERWPLHLVTFQVGQGNCVVSGGDEKSLTAVHWVSDRADGIEHGLEYPLGRRCGNLYIRLMGLFMKRLRSAGLGHLRDLADCGSWRVICGRASHKF